MPAEGGATDDMKDAKGVADGPSSGGGNGGSGGRSGGSAGGSGGGGGGAGGMVPDAAIDAPPAPQGASCSADGECALGVCADGFCCDKACTGCNACARTQTGQPDGTCASATSGLNPHSTCTDQRGTNQCGTDGTCDGAGACRYVSTSHVCTDSSCTGKVFTPVSTCDGKGACVTVTTQDCAPYLCAATGCQKTCTVPADCDTTTYYCDTTNKICASRKKNGSTASQGSECISNAVADGVCCDKADCSGCMACSLTLNGQTDGQCLPVPANKVGHSTCTVSNTPCGTTGVCDGAGKCQNGASGTNCGSTCSGSTLTPKTCDGAGNCTARTATSCAPYVCAATGDVCGGKKALGVACSAASECDSSNCQDNLAGTAKICCSVNCSTCQGCNSNGTGCTKKNTGAPDSACSNTAASCQNGTCNNAGACAVTPTVACGAGPSCLAGVVTAAYACNASGQCVPGGQTTCSTGACNAAGTGCSDQKILGLPCSQGSECISGFCAGNVCCDRACTGACEQCSSAGHCAYKSGAQCAAAPGVCANTAVCNGSSADCPTPTMKSGTTCGTAPGACANAPVCDGFSANCPAATMKSGTQCLAASGCANAAVCDGINTNCPLPTAKSAGTVCGTATSCANAAVCTGNSTTCPATGSPKLSGTPCGTMNCSGTTQSGPTCNASGTCGGSTSRDCYPFACVQGSGCKTSCTTNADCAGTGSVFCGSTGVCGSDTLHCWHADNSPNAPLWQITSDGFYHNYNTPGDTPADVCGRLVLCGFDDWRVPNIDELRSLIRVSSSSQECAPNVTGGACGITTSCPDLREQCTGPNGNNCNGMCDLQAGPGASGCYWPYPFGGACFEYWSSTSYADSAFPTNRYRFINFQEGYIWSCDPSDSNYVLCVRP